MDAEIQARVCAAVGADAVTGTHVVQSLWSGYGTIVRCTVDGPIGSVIVKRVQWPTARTHPRGWSSDRGHARKVRSYAVEQAWYRDFAPRCDVGCRVARCYVAEALDDGVFLILEDLDAAGYGARPAGDDAVAHACLRWLASFHATFLQTSPDGLWPVGTYWHLDTRPDELAAMPDGALKNASSRLDAALRTGPQTLVHGDAKLANFCLRPDASAAAAVDFQYVGGGSGIKDVAYFLGSCFDEDAMEAKAGPMLDEYFAALRHALQARRPDVDADAVEAHWRSLYAVAWTDFVRFLQGWSPGHWKLHRYSRRIAAEVLGA
ncbi:MAG: phosphotransferase [Myxococcota bacterium]